MRQHYRKTIRLKNYDYASAGVYFVTICTHDRVSLFGDIIDGVMGLSSLGVIVQEEWLKSSEVRREIELGEFIVMPNHIHGIVWIEPSVGAYGHTPLRKNFLGFISPSHTLGSMVRGFKSAAAKRINELRGMPGTPVWQRNYYEHVIRSEKSLLEIREYIENNPKRWALDENNPENFNGKDRGNL